MLQQDSARLCSLWILVLFSRRFHWMFLLLSNSADGVLKLACIVESMVNVDISLAMLVLEPSLRPTWNAILNFLLKEQRFGFRRCWRFHFGRGWKGLSMSLPVLFITTIMIRTRLGVSVYCTHVPPFGSLLQWCFRLDTRTHTLTVYPYKDTRA